MEKSIGKALQRLVSQGYAPSKPYIKRKKTPLANPKRFAIFQYLCKNPCSSMIEISKELNMNLTSMRWHLQKMQESEHISMKRIANRTVFIPSKMLFDDRILELLFYLSNIKTKKLIRAVIDTPGIFQSNLNELGFGSSQTCRLYLNKLEDIGVITSLLDGKYKRYYPTDYISSFDKSTRKALREFRNYIVKRFEEEGLSPQPVLSPERKIEIQIRSPERQSLLVPTNIYSFLG